ncbi:MAG: hypothetical protein Kow00107_07130 [Planctomycetota bacterium]
MAVNGDLVLSTVSTGGGISLVNSDGEEILEIPAPFASELGIVREGGRTSMTVDIVKSGSSYLMYFRTPLSWLKDSNRSFPLVIDPSVTLTAKQNANDTAEQGYTFNCFLNSGTWGQTQYMPSGTTLASLGAFIGCWNGGANPYHSMVMWKTDSLNDYAEVLSVGTRVFQSYNWSYSGSGQTCDSYHVSANMFDFPYDIDPTDNTASDLPPLETYPTLFTDMENGHKYASDIFSTFTASQWYPSSSTWWDLGEDAAGDCESQLINKYFGFSIATKTSTAVGQKIATFSAYNDSVTVNRNLLRITYVDSATFILDSNYNGATIAVDGIVYDSFPATFTITYGNKSFAAEDEISIVSSQERYKFRQWSNGDTSPSTSILVDKNYDFSTPLTAYYDHQFYLEIVSVEGNIDGDLEGWYNSGTIINTSISGAAGQTIDTRRMAIGWTAEGSAPTTGTGDTVPPFTITAYTKIVWIWEIQYKLSMQGALTAFIGPEPGWYFRNQTMSGVGVFPWVQVEEGIRRYAYGWTAVGAIGDGLGDVIPDWTMSKPTIITWLYEIRYELGINSAHGAITGDPADYFVPGTEVNTGVERYVVDPANPAIRYEARGWTAQGSLGNGNGNNIPTFTVNEPTYITWNWVTQYKLTITSLFGTVSPETGTWFDAGTSVNIVATVPPDDDQQRYVWSGWLGSGDGSINGGNPSDTVLMNAPLTMEALWAASFYLTLNPGNGYFVDDLSGWYDYGESVVIQALPPDPALDTRYILGWQGTGPGARIEEPSLAVPSVISISILGPTSQNAIWVTQYRFKIRNTASYGDPRPMVGDYWVTSGETFYGSVMPNVGGMLCNGYIGTGSLSNGTLPIFSVEVTQPSSVTWLWREGVDLPMSEWNDPALLAQGFRGRNIISRVTPDGSVYAVVFYSQETRELRCHILHDGKWNAYVLDKGENKGTFVDMELDANGNPHIVYYDGVNQDIIYTWFVQDAKPGVGAFQSEIVESGNFGRSIEMELSSIGEVHMVYYDQTLGDARYLRRTPEGWLLIPIFDANDIGYFCSIALTPLVDIPQVVYLDRTSNTLKYAVLNGSTWAIEDILTAPDINGPISITLDIGGRPFVGYRSFEFPDTWAFSIANQDETGWHSSIVVEDHGDGINAAFRLDTIGYIHLAYNDGEQLNYLRYNGRLWERHVLDLGPVNNWEVDLFMNQDEEIIITYWNGNDLKAISTSGFTLDMDDYVPMPPNANVGNDILIEPKGSSGCFVATAAFGSLAESAVKQLCSVRDALLFQSGSTASLVSLYYSASPSLAATLADNETLRAVMRHLLGE